MGRERVGYAIGRRWTIAGCLLLLGMPVGVARADSLNEALVSAYLGNPRLEAGRATLRATDEVVPQALAAGRPRLFLDATLDAFSRDTDVSERDQRATSGVDLSLRQPLYAGGGIQACIRQAESTVRAERAFLLATEQQVLLDAVDAYTATWRDRAVLDLAQRPTENELNDFSRLWLVVVGNHDWTKRWPGARRLD